jgi:ABC-type nitrate/sulfonate/bicarbonate transport system substrate-binding protein
MVRLFRVALALLAALVLSLAPVRAIAAEKVVLQLIWDHQFQFAGYYAAKWKGFYADAGLEVEIRPGVKADRSLVRFIDELKAGRVDFTIAAANILVERDRGIPISVLATIFQESPVAFYYRQELGRITPADLVKLRVARRIGGITDVEFQSMLRNEGIDPSSVEPFKQKVGIENLVEGRIDVFPGYTLATPLTAQKRGLRVMSLRPQDYGVDFYGDSLITHQRLIDRDP